MATATFDFTNETVLISGAARGIGQAMVRQFTDSGATVIAVDRDTQGLEETKGLCPGCHILPVDIGDAQDVERLFRFIESTFSRLHVCINNAAVAPHQSLESYPVQVWDRVFDVNCKGTFLMTRAAAALMKQTETRGSIVNFSSAAAVKGGAGSTAYASSRAAVESFSRIAAIELAPSGIRVNTIRPGLIDTQPKPLPPSMREGLEKRIPTLLLQRAGQSEEVGNVAMFLSSTLASYMTGSVITVDGGSLCGPFPTGKIVEDDIRYSWLYEQ